MVDETEEGNLFAALRTREADLTKHLSNGKDDGKSDAAKAAEKAAEQVREQDREKARLRLEEETKKNPGWPCAARVRQRQRLPVEASGIAPQRAAGDGQQNTD
jgi:hypothetical protein